MKKVLTDSTYKPKVEAPTPEQTAKTEELLAKGYIWNKQDSISAAGVVMDKDNDRWFFGLSGEIEHIGSFKS